MSSLLQRLLAPPEDHGIMGLVDRNPHPGALAVTADLRFYANLLNAASAVGWKIAWVRSIDRAIEIYNPESMPIVIYDASLPGIAWCEALDRLSKVPNRPHVLLASARIDEDLWRQVLRLHGYDILERSAGSEELIRAFRFAWLSRQLPAED